MNDILFGNNNKVVIQRLAAQRIRHNKPRNVFIGIVILLATAILAFVSCYAYNITHEYASQTSYQAIYLNLSQESISRLKENKVIEKVGLYQSAGMTNKENGITMGLVCSDEIAMKLSNIALAEGSMPQDVNELLVEQGYLDALNLHVGIGDTMSVTYRNQASRELETKDFKIVGFIGTTAEDDANRIAYNAVVSQKFVQENKSLSLSRYQL